MMKTIKYIIVSVLAMFATTSCNTLDIEDIYDYNAELVWNDQSLVNAYMANLYANVFSNWSPSLDQSTQQLSGIVFYPDRINMTNGEYKLWNYTNIRLINEAIQNVSAGNLPDNFKNEIIAQSKFLRAYVYFDMVVYHGGVPYIKIGRASCRERVSSPV